ncbi:MAG: SDR family NAD(P)-dependent oxidoreductase [Planctomycetes bacterium]|nr:SDR family NAD(P)-dependent oxidoreductase [Planctomycetota bacterium]
MGQLAGKVAVVTGAGGGLGRAHALALAAAGAAVVVIDLGGARDGSGGASSAADKVVADIRSSGGKAVADYGSVADPAAADGMIRKAVESFGRLDILVNNAGILRDKSLLKMDDAQWRAVLEVHLHGTFFCSRAAARAMKELARGGRIINTTSVAGLRGNFGQSNYSAAKAGIYGLTLTHAMELRKEGITVNAIAPIAKTRMTEDIPAVPDDQRPEQVSPMAVFLASDLSREVTGRIFAVHGRLIFEWRMGSTPGVELERDWTARDIAERLEAITGQAVPAAAATAAPAAASVAPSGSAAVVERGLSLMPELFVPEKAAGWRAVMHFAIQGAGDYTLTVADGRCAFARGKEGTATCVVKSDAETWAGMVQGKVRPEKAFMEGRITATNMADMMKMGAAFDLRRGAQRLAQAAPIAKSAAPAAAAATAAPAVPSAAPAGPAALVASYLEALPGAYRGDKVPGWEARVAFQVEGAGEWTVKVSLGRAQVTRGLDERPTCLVKVKAEAYARMIRGELTPERAFMEGHISASNLTDMMKFGQAFDLKQAAQAAAGAGAAAPASAAGTPVDGLNRALIGRKYRAGPFIATPEMMVAYARGTNDDHPWYCDPSRPGGIVAPPVFPVRVMRDVLFMAIMDPELNADLVRLVHGEEDLRFLRPVRPMDIFSPRAEISGIEDKSSGQIVHVRSVLWCDGEPVVDGRASMFIRARRREGEGARAPEAAGPAPRPAPAFSDPVRVTEDQTWRYAEASGDHNPIHVDVNVARAAGFPNVILQGLCTMAFASQAVVKVHLAGHPERLRRIAVRFSKPVLPGDTITTRGWVIERNAGVTTLGFESANQDGVPVLVNGVAEVV